MQTHICDRCGKEIIFEKRFKILQEYRRTTLIFDNKSYDFDQNNFDLCEKCAKDFDTWLKVTGHEHACQMIDNGVELCCSVCDSRYDYDADPKFCMMCGAKVTEE